MVTFLVLDRLDRLEVTSAKCLMQGHPSESCHKKLPTFVLCSTETGKKARLFAKLSQAEPGSGRESTQHSPRLLTEPSTIIYPLVSQ